MRVCFGQKIQYFFWQKSWYFWKMGKFEVPSDSPEEDELHELFQISIHQKILWRSIQWRFQCTLRAFDPMIFSQRVGLLCTWRVSTFQEGLSMNVAIVAKGWARSKLWWVTVHITTKSGFWLKLGVKKITGFCQPILHHEQLSLRPSYSQKLVK